MRCLAPWFRAVSACLLAGTPFLASASTGPAFETPQGTAAIVSRWQTAPRGGDAGLGVRFALAPGWHVYWKNSGDAGYPPALAVAPTAGLAAPRLLFPAPERFTMPGGLVSFGYGGTMVYPVAANIAPDAPARVPVRARLDYLVCADECIPYTADLALDLPVGDAEADPEAAPLVDRWRDRLPRAIAALAPPPAASTRWIPGKNGAATIELALSSPGLRAAEPDLFFESQDVLALGPPRLQASAAGPAFRVEARPLDRTRPLPQTIRLAWTATGFETATGPLALEGVAELAPEPPERGAAALWIAGVAAVVALVLVSFRRRTKPQGEPA